MTAPGEQDGRDAANDRDDDREQAHVERISAWEWVAGAIGLLIVLAALALLLHEATQPSTPPDVAVRLDSVSAGRNVFVAHFTARNAGTEPATAVEIEGMVVNGADTLTATATVGYLPGESQRSGGLFFPIDPRTRELRMRAVGYESP